MDDEDPQAHSIRSTLEYFIYGIITLLAGFVRFYKISHPAQVVYVSRFSSYSCNDCPVYLWISMLMVYAYTTYLLIPRIGQIVPHDSVPHMQVRRSPLRQVRLLLPPKGILLRRPSAPCKALARFPRLADRIRRTF